MPPCLNIRLLVTSADFERVAQLRTESYGRHPDRYIASTRPEGPPTGVTIGAFSAANGDLQASIRIHMAGAEPVPAALTEATADAMCLLKVAKIALVDKFVAGGRTDGQLTSLDQQAAFAVCAAGARWALANGPKIGVTQSLAFAQKPLAVRYTRVSGYSALSPKMYFIPELSVHPYLGVVSELSGYPFRDNVHPLFKAFLLGTDGIAQFSEDFPEWPESPGRLLALDRDRQAGGVFTQKRDF